MHYAHSTNDGGRENWQSLREHLIDTANLAGWLGQRIGVANAARLAGLLHDVGKYTPEFQARLDGARERVDHSTAGAVIAQQLAKAAKPDDRLVAELIAYAIAGHHAGLPDKHGESFSTLSERLGGFSESSLDLVWKTEIEPDATGLLPAFNWERKDQSRAAFQLAFLGRMIFSCLVDADFKDTERFYARIEGREVDRTGPRCNPILPGLINAFDRHMNEKRSTETAVNRLRADILDHVRARAGEPPRPLHADGADRRRQDASLGFALDHARVHGHDRIIYAIPFTAVIDQTAAIFRSVLGDGIVLEHHSAIEDEGPPWLLKRMRRFDASAAHCYPRSRRTASPIRSDMIFGKDSQCRSGGGIPLGR